MFRLRPSSQGGYEFTLTDTCKVWQELVHDSVSLSQLKVKRGAANVDLDSPERAIEFVTKMSTGLNQAATVTFSNTGEPTLCIETAAFSWKFYATLAGQEQLNLALSDLLRWQMRAASALNDQNVKTSQLVEELAFHVRSLKSSLDNNESYVPARFKSAYELAFVTRLTPHITAPMADPCFQGAKALCIAAPHIVDTKPFTADNTSMTLPELPKPGLDSKPTNEGRADRLKRRKELQNSLSKKAKH